MAKKLLAICALFLAPTALANQVTQVSAQQGSVRITADEPPNFTTFTIDYPPRLVIDVAGATLVDVPTSIPVGQNGVQSIQTFPYGSGTSAVARVIIMYDKPVQTDILTDGNSIVVRQAEAPSAAPVVANAQAAPPAAAPTAAPAVASAQAAPPASPTPAAPAAPAVQQAARPPPSPTSAAPEPKAPQIAAAVPPSPKPPAAEPVVAPPPPAQPPRHAEAAAPPPPAPPPAEAPAENPEPMAASEEPTPPPAEPPAAPQPTPAPMTPQPAPPPPAPPPPSPEPLAAATPTPPAPAAASPAPAPALARAETPAPIKLNTQAELASPPPPPPAEEPPVVTARRKTLSLVGLRFNKGSASVFVRTSEPVAYHVSERPNGLVVTIENTRIRRRNDTRPLDAQFFDSPIAKVRATQIRGDVQVDIDLKSQAPYRATQSGREVELNFGQQG